VAPGAAGDAKTRKQTAECWEKLHRADAWSLYAAASMRAVTADVVRQDSKSQLLTSHGLLAGRMECDGADRIRVSFQDGNLLARGGVPQAGRVVVATGQKRLAVRKAAGREASKCRTRYFRPQKNLRDFPFPEAV
jgi:hypothetical protein